MAATASIPPPPQGRIAYRTVPWLPVTGDSIVSRPECNRGGKLQYIDSVHPAKQAAQVGGRGRGMEGGWS